MTLIRLGTASPATQPTKEATLAAIAAIASRAAAQRIDILLLPEAYIGGYPRGTNFGARIGSRTDDGREEYARYYDAAADLGDTVGDGGAGAGTKWLKKQLSEDDDEVRGDGTREELERIASDSGVFIVTGLVEKAGGTLYCSVVYVCPKQGMLGKRRKVMPTGTERLCWGQGSPATLKAVSTTIRGVRINLAAAICWENYMPLLRQTLYSQNINLYLAPTADARDAWLSLMRTVGCEGRCFVVSSNMAVKGKAAAEQPVERAVPVPRRRNSLMTEDGFEIALPTAKPAPAVARRNSIIDENGNEIVLCANKAPAPMVNGTGTSSKQTASTDWVCRGGSSIVSPLGDVLAGPQWEDDEGIIYADVDFRECIRGRLDLDTAGSYSRNDSFKFSVAGLDLDPLPY